MRDCQKQSSPQHRKADSGRWSRDDVLSFRIEVGRTGTSISIKDVFNKFCYKLPGQ